MAFSLRKQFDLDGRVALVIGCTHVLGPELAAGLAEYGAQLALADINAEALAKTADELRCNYEAVVQAWPTDITDETAVAGLVAKTLDAYGRIDILLNAAAFKPTGYFRAFTEYDLEDWNKVMAVNLTGMFLSTKHVVPHLIKQGHGNIINISSIYGLVGPDPRVYEGSWYLDQQINTPAVYAASKGGVVSFTRYLATTLAQYSIRANAVTPGGAFSGQNEDFVSRYSDRTPLKRMADPEELRGVAVFLASDASSYITGQNIIVDGGWSAW